MKRLTINLVTALSILMLFLCCLALYRWYPWRSHVYLNGVVVDDATDKPVPNARVIVHLVGFHIFDENHLGYGIIADANGKFSLDVRAPEKYSWLYVTASSPNDNFGWIEVRRHNVTVRTAPIPANRKGEQYLYYRDFRGSGALEKSDPTAKVEFIGERW